MTKPLPVFTVVKVDGPTPVYGDDFLEAVKGVWVHFMVSKNLRYLNPKTNIQAHWVKGQELKVRLVNGSYDNHILSDPESVWGLKELRAVQSIYWECLETYHGNNDEYYDEETDSYAYTLPGVDTFDEAVGLTINTVLQNATNLSGCDGDVFGSVTSANKFYNEFGITLKEVE